MSSDGLKSAYELAMERLQKRDEEAGVARRTLSDAEKAEIADIRSLCQARLAEIELRHQAKLPTMADPAERDALEVEYRRDRERLTDERDRKIARIRGDV